MNKSAYAAYSSGLVCSLIVLFAGSVIGAEPIPDIGPTGEIKQVHSGFLFTEGLRQMGMGTCSSAIFRVLGYTSLILKAICLCLPISRTTLTG